MEHVGNILLGVAAVIIASAKLVREIKAKPRKRKK